MHRETLNLCFHGIGSPGRQLEPGEGAYWITEELFASVLDEVCGRPDVRLSFDDGNSSDLAIGLDGLRRRGLGADFFVLAGRLDHPGSLGSEDVARLRQEGMRIGSHGMDHRSWRGLDEPARQRELEDARLLIQEAAGARVDRVALPRGEYDRRTLAQLRRAGYVEVHTSDRRRARPGAWLQPRYSVRATDTVDSLRREVLAPPSPLRRAERASVCLVKRWR